MNLNPWPYTYVRKLVTKATLEAQQQGLRPALAKEVAKNYRTSNRFNIPFLGDYIPEGWARIDDEIEPVFVLTSSGVLTGSNLSQQEFFKRAKDSGDDIGYGVIERGQVQMLIATYRKEADAKEKSNH